MVGATIYDLRSTIYDLRSTIYYLLSDKDRKTDKKDIYYLLSDKDKDWQKKTVFGQFSHKTPTTTLKFQIPYYQSGIANLVVHIALMRMRNILLNKMGDFL